MSDFKPLGTSTSKPHNEIAGASVDFVSIQHDFPINGLASLGPAPSLEARRLPKTPPPKRPIQPMAPWAPLPKRDYEDMGGNRIVPGYWTDNQGSSRTGDNPSKSDPDPTARCPVCELQMGFTGPKSYYVHVDGKVVRRSVCSNCYEHYKENGAEWPHFLARQPVGTNIKNKKVAEEVDEEGSSKRKRC